MAYPLQASPIDYALGILTSTHILCYCISYDVTQVLSALLFTLIYSGAWKRNSANFALTEF
jgi:hypothetical protein